MAAATTSPAVATSNIHHQNLIGENTSHGLNDNSGNSSHVSYENLNVSYPSQMASRPYLWISSKEPSV